MTPELLFGPYAPPPVRVGQKVACEARDREVICGGLVDVPIGPWPRMRKTGRPALIVTGSLVKALKQESELAIAYWWGVSVTTVWAWRKAVGAEIHTPGTRKLLSGNADIWRASDYCEALMQHNAKAFAAKQSADRKGIPALPQTRAALLKAAKKRKTKAHRAAIGAANKGRKPVPAHPWTREEEKLLGTTFDRHVAKALGRTVAAVRNRRHTLGIQMSRHAKLRIEAFIRGDIRPKRENGDGGQSPPTVVMEK